MLLGASVLAGCSSSSSGGTASGQTPAPASSSTTSAPSSDPFNTTGFIKAEPQGPATTGGTLTAQTAEDPPNGLDPIQGTIDGLTGMTEYTAIFDVLMRYDPITKQIVPQLAQSMTSNAAGNTWTIKLRPGVKFSDGTPLNAAAVKYNLERWGSKASVGYYYPTVAELKNIQTPNPSTVVINLKAVDREFNWIFTQGFGLIGSPTAIRKMGQHNFSLHPVGAGPFMVTKYSPTSELDVVRNPSYWGGHVPLDGIHFVFPTGDSTNLQSLQNGDLGVINLSDPTSIQTAIKAGYGGYMWIRTEGSTMIMNERKGNITSDVNVRRAIDLAINPAVINQRAYNGNGSPTSDLFPSNLYGTTVKGNPPNPAEAKKLVAAAKVADHWDGSLPILCKPSPQNEQICLAEQAMLNAVGFKATVKNAPSIDEWIQDLYVKGAYVVSSTSNQVTGSAGLYTQLTEEFVGAYTPTGYNNPKMTAAMNLLLTANTPAAISAALDKVQTVYNQTVPEVVVANAHNALIWKNLGGVVANSGGSLLLNKAYLTS
jgi:peptide/nickel transport system substrate-binding protein